MGINLDYKGYKGEKKLSIIKEDEVKKLFRSNRFYKQLLQ